ncbi:hydroxyacylglutathione hydrolase [uncultured Shewanella sp.]|uniref:hydroxyacylglutathione hydrolase n=1 Tax=uncultured Shewanella sp. TaxID=173975 RepID=UPI00260B3B5C|nr:hydroxyacylglutathione hydrolase [uncultured Shewanella sp.]
MKIIRLFMNNFLSNYCHLIICEQTNEAIILDPLDVDKCLAEAERHAVKITTIVNTHEHFDHIEGNPGIVAATGAKIYAHKNAISSIPNVDVGLSAGELIEVGTEIRLRVLHTPGHTSAHVCLLSEQGEPALFCGDTLFNASAGNCKYGGNVNDLYHTFVEQLANLPDDTRIYPGHDYFVNNLKFSQQREPGNIQAAELLAVVNRQDPENRMVTTLGIERQINPFFRLQNEEIISNLKNELNDQQTDPKSVFIGLRNLRDRW